jgi:hypothetical protein
MTDTFMNARDLVGRMLRKEISACEVLEAHLQQIECINPKVNAIVTLVDGQARDRARRLDEEAVHGRFAGPLHGLPIAHKDLFETRGIRTTYGSPLFRGYVPDFNAPLIDCIRTPAQLPSARRTRRSLARVRRRSIRYSDQRGIPGILARHAAAAAEARPWRWCVEWSRSLMAATWEGPCATRPASV